MNNLLVIYLPWHRPFLQILKAGLDVHSALVTHGTEQHLAYDGKDAGQSRLLLSHMRLPMHSSSLSQCPSAKPHGFDKEQHVHVWPVQSHPVEESVKDCTE